MVYLAPWWRAAYERHWNLRAVFDRLHSGQPVVAPSNVARLGRNELDGETDFHQAVSESEVSRPVEAWGL